MKKVTIGGGATGNNGLPSPLPPKNKPTQEILSKSQIAKKVASHQVVEKFNQTTVAPLGGLRTILPRGTELMAPSSTGMGVAPLHNPLPNVMTDTPQPISTAPTAEVANLTLGDQVTYSEAYSIADELAKDNGEYYPNPLNDFEQVTYHFRLLMVSDVDFLTAMNSGTTPAESYSKLAKVILAETGVTGGVAIRDVSFTTIATLKKDEDVGNTKYTINLFESMGTSFLDSIRTAAIKLRIKNINSCPYFLELSFPGYDEDGNRYGNVLENNSDFNNGGKWVFMLNVNTIDTDFSVSGTNYTLNATSYSQENIDTEFTSIRDMMTIKGSTIGEMLDDLAKQLEKSIVYRYYNKMRTFEFKPHPIEGLDGEDPRTFPVSLREIDLANQDIYSMDSANVPTIQIAEGSVSDAIQLIYSISPKVQQLAKGTDQTSTVENNASKIRESIIFNIEHQTFPSGYERYSSQYMGKSVYYIHAFATDGVILTRKQVETSKEPDTQSEFIRRWREKGLLRKRYDYLYTGKNTEVINFDAKFNFAWAAILPQTYGYNMDLESATQYARYNESVAEGRAAIENANALRSELREQELETQRIDEKIAEANGDVELTNRLNLEKIESEKKRTEIANRLTDTANKFKDNLVPVPEMSFETELGEATTIYADELEDLNEGDKLFEISFSQQQSPTQKGAPNPYYRDRGIYGTILEQVHTGDYSTISLEIKGDPYWIGNDDLERRRINEMSNGKSDNKMMVDFYKSNNYILFNMRFPYNSDADGQPVFRENEDGDSKDGFTGFYTVTTVENIFEGGQFRQTINANRFTLVSMIREMGGQMEGDTISLSPEGSKAPSSGPNPPTSPSGHGRPECTKHLIPNASNEDVLIRTVWAECRNCSAEEQRAVANVIKNRMRKARTSNVRDIVMAPWQFSPWNASSQTQRNGMINLDPNGNAYKTIQNNISGILDGSTPDNTRGANHFYTGPKPKWANGQTPTSLGYTTRHKFFNLTGGIVTGEKC